MNLQFCVYVLFSHADNLLYIGYSANIDQRLIYHSNGRTKSTSRRRPLELIFCEYYLFEEDARKREKYFKTTAGKKALKLMLRETLIKMGYKGNLTIVQDKEIPAFNELGAEAIGP
jgi:putative endonuclease